jgi:hypothetical protein
MPSAILTSDLDAIFADPFFSSAVVFGAQQTSGHLDWTDEIQKDHSGFDVFVRRRMLSIRTGTLAGLAAGSAITAIKVDGVAFVVHDVNHKDDGLISDVALAQAVG